MKIMLGFIVGFAFGLIVALLFYFVFQDYNYEYVKTNKDYVISDMGGVLKKGVLLRVDAGMSEGFTRYILYLNLKEEAGIENYKTDKDAYHLILPYWLYPTDTIKASTLP